MTFEDAFEAANEMLERIVRAYRNVTEAQVKLRKAYAVVGFVFYFYYFYFCHYWLNGKRRGKKEMESRRRGTRIKSVI